MACAIREPFCCNRENLRHKPITVSHSSRQIDRMALDLASARATHLHAGHVACRQAGSPFTRISRHWALTRHCRLRDTARSPLAGVHKRDAHYSSRRGPRRRAQTWCSLSIAPCAS